MHEIAWCWWWFRAALLWSTCQHNVEYRFPIYPNCKQCTVYSKVLTLMKLGPWFDASLCLALLSSTYYSNLKPNIYEHQSMSVCLFDELTSFFLTSISSIGIIFKYDYQKIVSLSFILLSSLFKRIWFVCRQSVQIPKLLWKCENIYAQIRQDYLM